MTIGDFRASAEASAGPPRARRARGRRAASSAPSRRPARRSAATPISASCCSARRSPRRPRGRGHAAGRPRRPCWTALDRQPTRRTPSRRSVSPLPPASATRPTHDVRGRARGRSLDAMRAASAAATGSRAPMSPGFEECSASACRRLPRPRRAAARPGTADERRLPGLPRRRSGHPCRAQARRRGGRGGASAAAALVRAIARPASPPGGAAPRASTPR